MRHSILALTIAAMLAACGGNNPGTGGNGGGADMSIPPDIASTGVSCRGGLMCLQTAMSQTAFNACVAKARPSSKPIFSAFINCLKGTCGGLGQDAGTGACSSVGECVQCVQSGTSSTGQTNGPCTNGVDAMDT